MFLVDSLLSFFFSFGAYLYFFHSDFLLACFLSPLLVFFPLLFILIDFISDRIVYR